MYLDSYEKVWGPPPSAPLRETNVIQSRGNFCPDASLCLLLLWPPVAYDLGSPPQVVCPLPSPPHVPGLEAARQPGKARPD